MLTIPKSIKLIFFHNPMKTKMRSIFSSLVIALYLISPICCMKNTVEVINGLPDDSKPLEVRCQSKDDDLGHRILQPHEEFWWRFKPTLIGNTLFFCHFWWNGKDKSFDVYDNNKMGGKCINRSVGTNTCYWLVQQDGFYFSNINIVSGYEKKYDW